MFTEINKIIFNDKKYIKYVELIFIRIKEQAKKDIFLSVIMRIF